MGSRLAPLASCEISSKRSREEGTLQEDPPPSVFANRPATTNPRLRAFAPLCPQEWATVALGFVKEVDLISSRRQESLGVKKQENPMGGPKKQDDKEAWKKKPRFPKKGKQEESTS